MKIKLSKYQKSLFYEIFINKEYSLLDENIRNSSIIFDVGSNIGLFSLYVLSIKYNFLVNLEDDFLIFNDNISKNLDFKIHLFEPNIETFSLSKEILSNFNNNLILNNVGIFNKTGVFDMIIPNIDCQSSLYNSFLTKKFAKNIKSKFIKLEKYLSDKNISQIDLLKLDVEGAEFDILLNLDEKYFKKIKVLFFEYHLLSKDFEEKFEILIEKLRKIYGSLEIIKGKYSENIVYIMCK